MLDTYVNIIWLSDIHFLSSYEEDEKYENLNNYINSFHAHIDSIADKDQYDYILISGDTAQGGEAKEYELFIERIYNKLEKAFPNASLLIVPGNHDVNRFQTSELTSLFIDNIGINDKKDFLSVNKEFFYSAFENYSTFFQHKKLPTSESSLKDNKLLFGYVLNKEKKMLFILLNSAWYSVGNGFLNHYLTERVYNIDYDKDRKDILEELSNEFKDVDINVDNFITCLTSIIENKTYINNVKLINEFVNNLIEQNTITEGCSIPSFEPIVDAIIKFKRKYILKDIEYITNEYGKQLIGLDVFKKEYLKIEELYNTYNDFIVTTIMHHPINWLDFNERIPYKSEKDEISNFHDIKNFTDLLLTGHEHVPTYHKTEMINNNELLHIQAGCFMDAKKPLKFKAKKNWFSTLSININKRTVSQSKHYYDSDVWNVEELEPVKLNKKHDTVLSKDRKEIITTNTFDFRKLIDKDNFEKVIKLESNFYSIGKRLYMIIDQLEDKNFGVCFDKLKEMIDKNSLKKIYFIAMDHHHSQFKLYSNKENQKLRVLDSIKRDFDFKFDKLRNNFFSELKESETEKYKKLKLIGVIKPYWITETCI
ncbi:metallophosphoesterase family protein [Winogradskyella pulchriflava]|uniref:Metallophosphoesterase family protein n=1 Tax=Winogradskyella pulchriflava TaxID=1110688 RepID=A0ABV6Q8I5_9FLAO